MKNISDNKKSLTEKETSGIFASLSTQMHGMPQALRSLQRLEEAVAALKQEAENNRVSLSHLEQEVTERDSRIEELTQAGSQKEKFIQQLHLCAVERDYLLKKAHASVAGMLTKPLRLGKKILRRWKGTLDIELLPLAQLQRHGEEWQATGNSPQFLLMAEDAWPGLTGWYELSLTAVAAQPLEAKLYFDIGEGFDSTRALSFSLTAQGPQQIPLHVPRDCRAIRLDPCNRPGLFKLSAQEMRILDQPPVLPEEFLNQSGVYERLDGRGGNAARLTPGNDVHPYDQADFHWYAEADDPWFHIEDVRQWLRRGWYMIELRICSDAKRGNAKFYFDYGEGYSESASLALPFSSGQTVKRLCKLENIPRQIRFDPLDRAAKFSIEWVHFEPVLALFAHDRMLRRLRNCDKQYKDFTLIQIWKDLRAQAATEKTRTQGVLLQRYSQTFPIYTQLSSYAEWIAQIETPEFADTTAIKAVQQNFSYQPTISVVMPTFNTPEPLLRQAIESVLAQSYPNWELCIADDASREPHVRAVLEEYTKRDGRIKVLFRNENGHISAASNSALTLATGDYIALLDHDDELASHALHFMAEALNHNPSGQILYSDEDKIDQEGNRSEPHFKSDWNPDMFLSQNYVSHLGLYRRELLQRIGGFRLGLEGSQDHDLLLRCLPLIQPAEIVHIPKILYHWRKLEGSTALASGEKSYTMDAGLKALRDFFHAQEKDDVQVETGIGPGTYRVRYPLPQSEPLVTLLIPTRDMVEVLEPCLQSIFDKTTYQNYEILILDNESVEPATLQFFDRMQAEDGRVRVLGYHHPFNFSAINNFGVQHARGQLIGLVNNDIEVISPDWLTEMVSHAIRPEIGCVGAKLYYDDDTIQHAGVILGLGGVAGHSHKHFPRSAPGYFYRLQIIQNLSAVTAACLVVRKSIYQEVGGLEEEGLAVAFNDVDFCLKVRAAGYRNLWTPYVELYHHESKSRGAENTPEKVARFRKEIAFIQKKWGQALQHDPYYNQNLTLNYENFAIG